MNTKATPHERRVIEPPLRSEQQLRRYLYARERLERRRRAGTDRFAYLRRTHD